MVLKGCQIGQLLQKCSQVKLLYSTYKSFASQELQHWALCAKSQVVIFSVIKFCLNVYVIYTFWLWKHLPCEVVDFNNHKVIIVTVFFCFFFFFFLSWAKKTSN